MVQLRALYIYARGIHQDILHAIHRICSSLRNLYVFIENDEQAQYVIWDLPLKWLGFSYSIGALIEVPADIRRIDMIVENTKGVKGLGKPIAAYAQQKHFNVEHIFITVQPEHFFVQIYNILPAFLFDCMPKWPKLNTLQSISLTANGFAVEIPRPNDDKAENEIVVTLYDASYIAGNLTPVTGFYFTIIVSKRFPHYEGGDMIPASAYPEIRKLYGTNEFSALPSIETIRELHLPGNHIERLLQLMPELTAEPYSFDGLVVITGVADAIVDQRAIPFDYLRELRSLEHFYLYPTNQAFHEVNVAKCHAVEGAGEPSAADGICFYKKDVGEL